MAYDYSKILSGYEGSSIQNYLSQIDTPEEWAYALSEPFGDVVKEYGNPSENLAYWAAGLVDPKSVAAFTAKQRGISLDPKAAMLVDNPWMSGMSFVRPDIPSAWAGLSDPLAHENQAKAQELYGRYGVTPADYSQDATNWALNNSSAAQAARDDDGGLFGDLAPIIALAGSAFGAPYLSGLLGGGLAGSLGAGALIGGGTSALTGGDVLKGALLGGLGGGVSYGLGGLGSVADTTTSNLMSGLGDTTADILAGQAAGAAALPASQIGAMAGGSNMSWMDLLNQNFGTGNMGSMLSDTYTNTLGDWATSAVNPSGGLSQSGMMNLMGDFIADDKIQVLTNMGIPESVATSIAPSLSNQALQNIINLGGGLQGGSTILKSLLGGGGVAADGSDGMLGRILGTGANTLGGILQMNAAKEAAQATANAQIEAAKIAAEAAKFKPVGVTTRFGQSQFGYDDKGNLTSAGYNLSPEVKALQDQLMGMAPGLMTQYAGAQGATAPMGTAAQRAMALGQGYLGTDPAAQAAKYMAEQQALLTPYREREFADLENRLRQQGRLGLATGGTSTGLGAANPELEAFYNAKRMQDLQLAAQATQGGMDYAKFGAGMVGTGGDLLKSMYGTQTAAYAPFQTALGGATGLEQLGQGAMDIGTSLGAKVSTANAGAGQALASGMVGAAQTQQQAASSPWAALLGGAGNMLNTLSKPQDQYGMLGFDPNKYTLVPKANL